MLFLSSLLLQQPLLGQGPGQCLSGETGALGKAERSRALKTRSDILLPQNIQSFPHPGHCHVCHCPGSCATALEQKGPGQCWSQAQPLFLGQTDRQLTHRNPRQHYSMAACSGLFVSLATLPPLLRAHHPLQTTNC